MAKKKKDQTTTITLTMDQYNELEGVISFAHFNGYYDRLRKECNWNGYPETRSKDLKDYQEYKRNTPILFPFKKQH